MSDESNAAPNQFEFKTDRIEKRLSAFILVVFFLSLTQKSGFVWSIILFTFSAVIFAYYFIWFRKKPAYVVIEDDHIQINSLPFFKPYRLDKQQIGRIETTDKKIIINYNEQGASKSIGINSLLMGDDDWKKLSGLMKPQE